MTDENDLGPDMRKVRALIEDLSQALESASDRQTTVQDVVAALGWTIERVLDQATSLGAPADALADELAGSRSAARKVLRGEVADTPTWGVGEGEA